MAKPTRLDEVIRKYTQQRAAARRATARPQATAGISRLKLAMTVWALRAQELKQAGKIEEARKAPEQAELWRKNAGLE